MNNEIPTTTPVEVDTATVPMVDPEIVSLIDKKLDGYMTELKKMLEKKYPEPDPTVERPSIVVIGPRGPSNVYSKFAAEYQGKEPNRQFRFIYGHAESLPLRRMKGWEPVKDEKGDDVRLGDHILASMPKNRYQTEIVDTRNAKIAHKRQATANKVEENFAEVRDDMKSKNGVRFSGTYDVKYDNEG
jgi:hypothetical protein